MWPFKKKRWGGKYRVTSLEKPGGDVVCWVEGWSYDPSGRLLVWRERCDSEAAAFALADAKFADELRRKTVLK